MIGINNKIKYFGQFYKHSHSLKASKYFSSISKSSKMLCEIRNPLTNEVVYSKEEQTSEELLNHTKLGKSSQQIWSQLSMTERINLCDGFVEQLQSKMDVISQHISQYTGKPLKESQLEMKATIHRMTQLINISEDALKPEIIEDTTKKGKIFQKFITKHPLGTALIISPWNYPALTASSVLITALLAGNNVLLKPSHQTVGIADDFEMCFAEAVSQSDLKNIPLQNLVKNIYTSQLDILPQLYKCSDYVSFTGSVKTGIQVQQESICANPWINCVLELGGKDAVYIHKSCASYLDEVVKQITIGAFTNAGQSCCAVQRIYCDSQVLHPFIQKLKQVVENIRIIQYPHNTTEDITAKKENQSNRSNNNNQQHLEIGPLTIKGNAQFVKNQVDCAIQEGAQVLNQNGGKLIELPLTEYNKNDEIDRIRGYNPTILLNALNHMNIMQEEIFGPVLPIVEIKVDYNEALELMNDSKYGLTATIFSSDKDIIKDMSNKLNVGTILVNQCLIMDPLLPWIGWKQSGKNFSLSRHGFDQVTKMKSHNHVYSVQQE